MSDEFGPSDYFVRRHIGPTAADVAAMLAAVGADSLDDLMAESLTSGDSNARSLSARKRHQRVRADE